VKNHARRPLQNSSSCLQICNPSDPSAEVRSPQNSENAAKCAGNRTFSILSGDITRPCCVCIDHLNARSNGPRSAASAFRLLSEKFLSNHMRRNSHGSTVSSHNERTLLQQVTALQFEKAAMSLELKSLKEQQEAFLEEVEIEIEAQKTESLSGASTKINQLQLQLRQANDALKDRETLVSDLFFQLQNSASQVDKAVLRPVGVDVVEDAAVPALDNVHRPVNVSQDVITQPLESTNIHRLVAVQSSASMNVRHSGNSSQDTAALLYRIRIENFRETILRNFCYRIANAILYRNFRQWKCFVKEQALLNCQTIMERAIKKLWDCAEKIGHSKAFANTWKALRCVLKKWRQRVRIRRRLQNCVRSSGKDHFISWKKRVQHQRALHRLVQRKNQILFQKLISLWKHETLVSHIFSQRFQVQHAAEKFMTMHEAQNGAVLAIKQTCFEMMSDLESATLERNLILKLFWSFEGKLIALFRARRTNAIYRSLFQIWNRKRANRQRLIRLEERLARTVVQGALVFWRFDSKMRIMNNMYERHISEASESVDLERQTNVAALHNTEDELAETLSSLDHALGEIDQLVEINRQLCFDIEKKKKSCQDNEAQTEAVLGDSSLVVCSNVQTQDSEAQTDLESQIISSNTQTQGNQAQAQNILGGASPAMTINVQTQRQNP